jgi:hypothetical protein
MVLDPDPAGSPDGLVLSVRGDATETVEPDFGELRLNLTVVADTNPTRPSRPGGGLTASWPS